MDDMSKELEKEIARSKPKPYKKDRKLRILIVDDFGEMKAGEYLKTLIMILSAMSVFCFAAAVFLYYLYADLSRDVNPVKNRLVLAENKVIELTREKEILMARLVISGKEPGLKTIDINESEKEEMKSGKEKQ
ncbi:MAG: hypothetical protein KOO64_02795 [Desulfobacterales bacterium]|nr:hypothetical protein [Desulfobacterales bacterium]